MNRSLARITFLAAALVGAALLGAGCGGGGSSSGGGPQVGGQAPNAHLLWSVQDLKTAIAGGGDLVILDCRKMIADATGDSGLGIPPGETYCPYDKEHIEGSYWLDMFVFGDPYPTAAGVQKNIVDALEALGITTSTTICLYDTGIANPQGKIFFQLERQGCTDVHILDGGLPNWIKVGEPVTSIVPAPRPASTFVAAIDNTSYIELADLSGEPGMKTIFDMIDQNQPGADDYTMTDFREEELYDGHKICPDAIRTGHMPNCGFLSWKDYFDSSTGLLKSAATLEALNSGVGIVKGKTNVIICNKGWRTGFAYFVLRYLGFDNTEIRHYVGGIREWAGEAPFTDYKMVTDSCFDYKKLMGDTGSGSGKDQKRWSGAFAQLGDWLYCIGGYVLADPGASGARADVTDRVQAYNIANDAWNASPLPDLPEPIAFSVAAPANGNEIYVFGGLDTGENIIDKVYRYTRGTPGFWSDVTGMNPLPVGRFSFAATTAATSAGDVIVMCGGLTDKDTLITANYSDKTYGYHVPSKTWINLPDLPQGRRCHTMVTLNSTDVYCLGGFYYDDVAGVGIDLKDVLHLDMSVNPPTAWTPVGDLPMDLAGHVCVAHQATGKIYTPGGWSVDGIKYDMCEFDTNTNQSRILMKTGMDGLTKAAKTGWPRFWYFIGISGDTIAQIGGYGGEPGQIAGTQNSGFTHFNQTYVYDLTRTDP